MSGVPRCQAPHAPMVPGTGLGTGLDYRGANSRRIPTSSRPSMKPGARAGLPNARSSPSSMKKGYAGVRARLAPAAAAPGASVVLLAPMEPSGQVEAILRSAPALMLALQAARDIDAPDWLIAAGSIRNAVWDALHDREPEPPRDLDVLFFDPDDTS